MDKNTKISRLLNHLEKKDFFYNIYETRCNMNPTDEPLLVGNWNNLDNKLTDYIESIIDIHWDDEIARCDCCYGAILTTPCYYGDLPDYVIFDGEIVCKDCILEDESLQEDVIEYYLNETDKAIMPWFYDIIEKNGFICYSMNDYCEVFETGFHPGQTDDPVKIAKDIKENLPGYDFIFKINSAGQFDISWSVFIRREGE